MSEISLMWELVERYTHETPEELYHYTSTEGLVGIVHHNELWLTECGTLNDPTELHYGVGLFFDELQKLVEVDADTLAKMKIQIRDQVSVYVCCFTTDPDSLSQWHAYGDGGRGCAVGMCAEKINSEGPDDSNEFNSEPVLFKVKYDLDDLKEYVRRAFGILERLRQAPVPHEEVMKSYASFLNQASLWCGMMFKHAKYAKYHHEDEWRLALLHVNGASPSPSISFRSGRYGLTPFVKIPIWSASNRDSIVKSIYIGPCADRRMERNVRVLCYESGLEHVSVVRSETPYM